MKVIILILFVSISWKTVAASHYNCGSFSGRIPGAATYELLFSNPDSVTLITHTWEGKVAEFKTEIYSTSNNSMYENNDFKITKTGQFVYLLNKENNKLLTCK